jgi:hypothetical protein
VITKICTYCKKEKPLDQFYPRSDGKYGVLSICKVCSSEDVKKRHHLKYKTDPEYREKIKKRDRERNTAKWKIKSKDMEWMKNRRERRANSKLKMKHGIIVELGTRGRMIQSQSGRCMICNSPFKSNSDAHLDHNHKTGQIRDILCCNCNHGLGMFKDNPDIIRQAEQYLRKWS